MSVQRTRPTAAMYSLHLPAPAPAHPPPFAIADTLEGATDTRGESSFDSLQLSRRRCTSHVATYAGNKVMTKTQLVITIAAVSAPKARTAGMALSALAANAAAVEHDVMSVALPACM